MKAEQRAWRQGQGWVPLGRAGPGRASIVFVFGATDLLADGARLAELRELYPDAPLIGCSTAGEIRGAEVADDSVVATAVWFDRTRAVIREVDVADASASRAAGERLAASFEAEGLSHVMVFSEGLAVNGSELVEGMTRFLPAGVAVTGGLAGDGARFSKTLVIADRAPRGGIVAAVGLYGKGLVVGYGSLGGWDPFGPERVITRSKGNVLYELDRQPALALYKKYLGEHAKDLPASGLLFPLSVRTQDGRTFVRTILGVDEATQSLTFAGDMPIGAYGRLMKANFDRLVDGAHEAAATSRASLGTTEPALALLISCVGRKLVLGQRTAEEVDAVRSIVGPDAILAGFYSYGEICPAAPNANCELHNQTMTITTLAET